MAASGKPLDPSAPAIQKVRRKKASKTGTDPSALPVHKEALLPAPAAMQQHVDSHVQVGKSGSVKTKAGGRKNRKGMAAPSDVTTYGAQGKGQETAKQASREGTTRETTVDDADITFSQEGAEVGQVPVDADAATEPAAKKRRKEGKEAKNMEKERKSKKKSSGADSAGAMLEAGGDGQGTASLGHPAGAGRDLGERWEGTAVTMSGNGSGNADLRPFATFAQAGLPKKLLQSCARFAAPSPIQAHSWPVLLAGRDLVGIAATGSGKTLAYGLPGLAKVLRTGGGAAGTAAGRPQVLVLAPTRELVQQIAEVLEEAGGPVGLRCARIYGGTPKGPQRAALRAGAAVVAATPGRLMDLMEEGCISLSEVSFLVLDEADRMLDLGFEPAIRAIAKATPSSRQTVMQSATWPPAVGQLASEFLRDPIKVTVGSADLTANHDVTQLVEVVEDRARDARLEALLRTYHKCRTNRVLVFVLYKKEAARVESFLSGRGWKVAAIHGDKGQADRTRAVTCFKDGSVPLLVATDVAARGLDIPDVEYVINYSFPLTTEDYVHRIGRTGRAGRKGTAHTFFTQNDKARAGELVNVLREAKQAVPDELLKFGTTVKKKESKLYGAHFRELDASAPKAVKTTFADSDEE